MSSIENDLKKYGGELPPMKRIATESHNVTRSKELDILSSFNEMLRVVSTSNPDLVMITCPSMHTHFTTAGKCPTCDGTNAENKIRLALEQLLGLPFTRTKDMFVNKILKMQLKITCEASSCVISDDNLLLTINASYDKRRLTYLMKKLLCDHIDWFDSDNICSRIMINNRFVRDELIIDDSVLLENSIYKSAGT